MAQKFALVVGCNYPDTTSELRGCINDANSMHDLLIKRFGFEDNNIELLTDKPGSENKPTASKIKTILNKFFCGAKSGDVIVLFFAGHGTIIPGSHSLSGKDEEAIVPCDFNLITCIDFRELLDGAPNGVTFVFVSDSCHSGGLIDKEKEQIGPHHDPYTRGVVSASQPRKIPFEVVLQQLSLQPDAISTLDVQTHFIQLFGLDASSAFRGIPDDQYKQPLKPDQGILLSGCQSNEYSWDALLDGSYHGVFTWALLNVLKEHPDPITNRELVLQARQVIEKAQFHDQHPCLYCSDENVDDPFLHEKL